MSNRPSLLVRIVKGFLMFWWDFLVGDTPELFFATVVIIGVTVLLGKLAHVSHLAVVVLPVLVIGALFISVRRTWPKR
jgi:hypothetical protein